MKRADVIAHLQQAVPGNTNALWHTMSGLSNLRGDEDAAIVGRALEFLASHENALHALRKLPDPFVPAARGVIAKSPHLDARFLEAGGEGTCAQLRAAANWLLEFTRIEPRRSDAARVNRLAREPRCVEAAQVSVAQAKQPSRVLGPMVALLACEGSAESVDVLLPLIEAGLTKQRETLDLVREWSTPFASSAVMKAALTSLETATSERGARSNVAQRFTAFGHSGAGRAEIELESIERSGAAPKVSCSLLLQTNALPHLSVRLRVHRGSSWTTFGSDDGARPHSSKLELPEPTLDGLPQWLGARGTTLEVRLRCTRFVSTLRGRARAQLIEWLGLSGPAID